VVHEARDGTEAVHLAKSLRPDLVTLDVMMPDLNGFDVAALLRQDPATMQIPILVVSILHEEGRAQSVGVDRYLTKPVDTAQLLAHVEALLAQGGTHRRVVVVDDHADMLETLRTTLEIQGWQVTPVCDPEQALPVVRATRPNVVLARARVSEQQRLVDVLRAEQETQHTVFVLFE
jgi:DNA-binding response OmpR family regulator